MHLLPESMEVLSTQTEFPCKCLFLLLLPRLTSSAVGIALATFGILLTLGIDQAALHAMTKIDETDKNRCVEPMVPFCRHNAKDQVEAIEGHEHEHGHVHDADPEVKAKKVVPSHDVEVGEYHLSHELVDGSVGDQHNVEKKVYNQGSFTEYGHSHRHLHVPHDCDELGKDDITDVQ